MNIGKIVAIVIVVIVIILFPTAALLDHIVITQDKEKFCEEKGVGIHQWQPCGRIYRSCSMNTSAEWIHCINKISVEE